MSKNLEKCKEKIQKILDKHNCMLVSADEFTAILIRDKETNETTSTTRRGC